MAQEAVKDSPANLRIPTVPTPVVSLVVLRYQFFFHSYYRARLAVEPQNVSFFSKDEGGFAALRCAIA